MSTFSKSKCKICSSIVQHCDREAHLQEYHPHLYNIIVSERDARVADFLATLNEKVL